MAGSPARLPDLVRVAERRLSHGPFSNETLRDPADDVNSRPLLAAVAHALGRCGRDYNNADPKDLADAQATLERLLGNEDERVRDPASNALGEIKGRRGAELAQGVGFEPTAPGF